MVSEKVEIYTKSFREEARGVYWSCDGSPEFELYEIDKKTAEQKLFCILMKRVKNF
jgi:molecular chaperone HtpG